jgi:uncharacterized NAD-dependent epimerase/dehydratase family protein
MEASMVSKAKWVADLMKSDGVTADQLTNDLINAYMQTIATKIAAIQNTYLTRVGAKSSLESSVLSNLI